jgi:tetratricopeptide (TPR) repeat protein
MPPISKLDEAIRASRAEDHLRALNLFIEIYGAEVSAMRTPKDAGGLSYFGLALALVRRQFKPAIDLCRKAMENEFYNPDHYANLARVYNAAGNRKKAVEAAEQGLKLHPEDDYLIRVRKELGVRAAPAVPFLDRANPINVTLGQVRHAKKLAEEEKKTKR